MTFQQRTWSAARAWIGLLIYTLVFVTRIASTSVYILQFAFLFFSPYFLIYHKVYVPLENLFLCAALPSKMGAHTDATMPCVCHLQSSSMVWSEEWDIFPHSPTESINLQGMVQSLSVFLGSQTASCWCLLAFLARFNASHKDFCTLLYCFFWKAAFIHHWLRSFLFSFSRFPGKINK